jgi:hypothetical protein
MSSPQSQPRPGVQLILFLSKLIFELGIAPSTSAMGPGALKILERVKTLKFSDHKKLTMDDGVSVETYFKVLFRYLADQFGWGETSFRTLVALEDSFKICGA